MVFLRRLEGLREVEPDAAQVGVGYLVVVAGEQLIGKPGPHGQRAEVEAQKRLERPGLAVYLRQRDGIPGPEVFERRVGKVFGPAARGLAVGLKADGVVRLHEAEVFGLQARGVQFRVQQLGEVARDHDAGHERADAVELSGA